MRDAILKNLLLSMARERDVQGLAQLVCRRLAGYPDVAIVRLWLIDKERDCTVCGNREHCPGQEVHLNLLASAGTPQLESLQHWPHPGQPDAAKTAPLGTLEAVEVCKTSHLVYATSEEGKWRKRYPWTSRENVIAFSAQPLISNEQVLGVLGTYLHETPDADTLDWMRIVADHCAAAVTTARAFEEIQRLRNKLDAENQYLRQHIEEEESYGQMVGTSPSINSNLQQIKLVAPTDASVMILGESGVGKELVAHEIHRHSRRHEKPLIRVNCAAIPQNLYESEFFGHAKGAFTGAIRDRAGRFEAADGGSLFLDEVGEIPLDLQGKLLRVLQEGTYERVGEEKTRHTNVRIIAATNRDLKKEIAAKRFREDLYYRLNVFPISVAPLRERKSDIPALAQHFVNHAARRLHCPNARLTRQATDQLLRYDWPGNIRELQNVVERAVITASGGDLQFDAHLDPGSSPAIQEHSNPTSPSGNILTIDELHHMSIDNMRAALDQTKGKIYGPNGAAALLQIKPTTLISRMKKAGLSR